MLDISFYTPSDEHIPTELRLKASGFDSHPDMQVIYSRVENEFAYIFTFYHVFLWQENTIHCCHEAVERIASLMCSQSYDHGASWRTTNIQYLSDTSDEHSSSFKVNFRKRDAG
jgi:hypothetical protein